MFRWFHALLALVKEAFSVRRDAQIRFRKAQINILRAKLPGNRVIVEPDDRNRLLRIGQELEHNAKDVLQIVTPKTYRRWIQEQRMGKVAKRVGRPGIMSQVRSLVVRLARENIGWGLKRILGELAKLQIVLGRSSVRRVLREEGLFPESDRRRSAAPGETPWRRFIQLHLNTMVACDFLSKTVFTPLGRKTAYLLMFIHLETRKVFLSPATYHPDNAWVVQQARNVSMWMAEQGIEARFLIRDRDTKFTPAFDGVWESAGAKIVRTPVAAPNANAFAEAWIGRFKAECLNYFLYLGLAHLNFIAQSFIRFYNNFRPHQSKGNRPLTLADQPPSPTESPPGRVRCQRFLGGLLKHYYREAA